MDLSGVDEISSIDAVDAANATDYINTYEFTKSSFSGCDDLSNNPIIVTPLEYKPTLIEFKDDVIANTQTNVEAWGVSTHELHSYSADSFKDARKDYEDIKVSVVKDDTYEYYYFQTADKSSALLIIKFETIKGTLLNINNVIIPLKEFISFTSVRTFKNDFDLEMCPTHELRSTPVLGYEIMMAGDHSSTTLHNVTIPLIMRAITYFTKEFGQKFETDFESMKARFEPIDLDAIAVPNECKEANKKQKEHLGLIRFIFKYLW